MKYFIIKKSLVFIVRLNEEDLAFGSSEVKALYNMGR